MFGFVDTVGDHVPEIAVVVVDPDGVREAVGVRIADLGSRQAASPEMVCPWFSMTKIATATAAQITAIGASQILYEALSAMARSVDAGR